MLREVGKLLLVMLVIGFLLFVLQNWGLPIDGRIRQLMGVVLLLAMIVYFVWWCLALGGTRKPPSI